MQTLLSIFFGWFPISEEQVNAMVAKSFPRQTGIATVAEPMVAINEGRALFCAKAQVQLVNNPVKFCVDFEPYWDGKTSELKAKNIQLNNIAHDQLPAVLTNVLNAKVNQYLLPQLDGTVLYKNEEWLGKQIKHIELKPGKIVLSFRN